MGNWLYAAGRSDTFVIPMKPVGSFLTPLLIAGSLYTLGLPSAVRAQELGPYVLGPYLKADGGVDIISGPDFKVGGSSGDLSLDTGYRVDGVAGYGLSRWLAVELEGGLIDHSVSSLTLRGLTIHPEGDSTFTEVPLLANVVFRYENPTDYVPYIGLGAGGVFSELKFSGDKDNDTVFALQAKVGLIYKLQEQAWLDVGYKFLGTAEQSYSISGMTLKTDQVYSHFFGVSVIWKF